MTEVACDPPGVSGVREQQLIRLDGTVLVSFLVPPGQHLKWVPWPGGRIYGACAGRVRLLPDGSWYVLAYFPEGYPGPVRPWPGLPVTR